MMSTTHTDVDLDQDIDRRIAERVSALRQARSFSLAALAEASGVSKAMISRVERAESSASATLLGRLAAGLGVGLAELLAPPAQPPQRLRRRAEQPLWRDPDKGYRRRQVAARDADGVELVEVELPRGVQVPYPPWSGTPYRQRLWLLDGELQVDYGDETFRLAPGDALSFAVDRALAFKALGARGCRYLLVIG
jgi:transcriptional regulator with XRE-family HTH domain